MLLAGSAFALSQQALRGGPTRWNVFLIIAAYVALVSQSVIYSHLRKGAIMMQRMRRESLISRRSSL